MKLSGMGAIAAYINNTSLAKKEETHNGRIKEETDPQIEEFKRWAENQRKSEAIGSIYGKMMCGANLTDEEMEYLRLHAPEQYEKAVYIQKEREAYKKELERCQSKEDVERLYERKMSEFYVSAKAIISSDLPLEKKREQFEYLNMRMMAVITDHSAFISSKKYQALPDKSKFSNTSVLIQVPENNKDEEDAAGVRVKCLIIASRIMKGDDVPIEDYKYLAKNDIDLYSKAVSLRRVSDDPKRHDKVSDDKETDSIFANGKAMSFNGSGGSIKMNLSKGSKTK